MDNLSPKDMMDTLNIEVNKNMIFKAGEGGGASGSFFFFSHDNKLLIKTLNQTERDKFLRMIDDFIEHLKLTENRSLIARIYGIYTLRTQLFKPVDIMIM